MLNESRGNTRKLRARIVQGSAILLSGSTLATACSFAYNIVIAHFLGPDNYGQAVAVYTVLTLVSALTLSFQLLAAKATAQQETARGKGEIYRALHRQAAVCGAVTAFSLILFEKQISAWLHLSSPVLILLIAIGAGFYVPLGTRRGYIQGAYGFRRLAGNLVLEAAVRLGGSLVMVLVGTGVTGVIAANAAASIVSWAAIRPELSQASGTSLSFRRMLPEMSQALVFFSGQMLINNSDMVLVKHFFLPALAGLYAAVALVGRVIYTFSSAVMNSMFPVVAGAGKEDRKCLSLIATSLLLVLGSGAVMTLGLLVLPARIWTLFFGAGFQLPGEHGLPFLLALKAVACIMYSLSVVIIGYEMSYKIANTSRVQLVFSGAVIAGICRFHSSLEQVILVQLVLMIALLLATGIPFLREAVRHSGETDAVNLPSLSVVRRSSEAEVIAEFLKSDLHHIAYGEYRESLRPIVLAPDLNNPAENAQRMALLFMRHLALWKELPEDTQWYEVAVKESDLSRIRVFPRAQWRRLAAGRYAVPEVVARLRDHVPRSADDPFAGKIDSMSRTVQQGRFRADSVLMIGRNDDGPLTVIDGNHRLISATLAGRLDRLHFFCGVSPRMDRCCWLQTNLVTLSRYTLNLLRHSVYDPEAELIHCCQYTAPLPGKTVPMPAAGEYASGNGAAAATPEWIAGISSKLP